jgi:hypothetical protein
MSTVSSERSIDAVVKKAAPAVVVLLQRWVMSTVYPPGSSIK